FTDQIPRPIKNARVARLRELDTQKKIYFYQQHCGTEQNVLFEGIDEQQGLLKGFSENYIPVQCKGAVHLVGSVVPVRLLNVQEQGSVFGKVISLGLT
ncbi:MAG: tRNA (N(6)-L-threonylcarbamoyladenosine(37)-C(2))-methylthiotransferase MtaB, partial [Candidatus Electrothrix sp. AU1_5]|nr:tRNA (N(6)-L-threonylcarbamoyladenosine(37)-C(2))-methylthiotransferase MtaB [Candidatus Electrothrix gigas]